ncbi:hypothetical protein niasHS_007273 [Heterodera schachtii]|uniref:Peptidase M12A domain-containing protein n=1 Tax=Heterodera schachtii TaxID=97005 RepID=A0ABD2JJY2_HETSC
MSSTTFTLISVSSLIVLLVGYYVQRYGMPPPPPKIAGIDLGTTFSSVAIFQPQTGETIVLKDPLGKRSIPSVVGFLENGEIVVGTRAVEQQEMNPENTIYDTKRFIGRRFSSDDLQFESDRKRYPFTIKLDEDGFVYFEVHQKGVKKQIRPEEIGAIIIKYLRKMAQNHFNVNIPEVVISVPAEFDQMQRNYTTKAVELAGMNVRRVISEPTAAALSYGLHSKKGVEYIVVVDVGGGTMDVSILWLNNAVFVTQAMAGNNRLGGQDFNERIQRMLLQKIREKTRNELTNREDVQQLRLAVEEAKLRLTVMPETWISLDFRSIGHFEYFLTRQEFEHQNVDLFASIVQPIQAALDDCDIGAQEVDEIVLVGGSTRIPRIRQIVGTFFGKSPNFGVDPELAVVIGVAVQAGVVVNGWPLQVAAMELPFAKQKRHIYRREQTEATDERLRKGRTLTSALSERWHSFPIPYAIGPKVNRTAVREGIANWARVTCLTFKEVHSLRTDRHGLIAIRPLANCATDTPKKCPLGHVVTILSLFPMKSYDFGSVMHYDALAFSSTGLSSIQTVNPNYQNTIGQRFQLSFNDVKKMNLAYCHSICPFELPCQRSGYTDPTACDRCRCPNGLAGRFCDRMEATDNQCGELLLQAIDRKQTLSHFGVGKCNFMGSVGTRVNVSVDLIHFVDNETKCQKESYVSRNTVSQRFGLCRSTIL